MIVNKKGSLQTAAFLLASLMLTYVISGCTPAKPQFGFDFSSEQVSSDLVLKFNVEALNIQNQAKVNISGTCRNNSTLKLLSPMNIDLSCVDGSYSKDLDLSSLDDGNINFKIEELNVFKELNYVEASLIKDLAMPSLTFPQPANLGSGTYNITLSGTCSENGESVKVFESSTNLSQETVCQSSAWSLNFDLGTDVGITSFVFKATHKDKANNTISITSSSVSRTVVGDYTIAGVATSAVGPFSNILKSSFTNYFVSWSAATNILYFSLSIFEFNATSKNYDIRKCLVTDIGGSVTSYSLSSGCALNPATNYQVQMVARNDIGQDVNRSFNFSTKALPQLKSNMTKLYIATSFDTATATNLKFSDLVDNYDTSAGGLYSLSINGFATPFSSLVTIDNANQKIVINPGTTRASGRFMGNLVFTDPFGNVSSNLQVTFYLLMPFTWVGLVDNDFNKPANWCGTFTLNGGCQGGATAPSFSAKVMIDDMCSFAVSASSGIASNCAPRLTANTSVHSFFIKANSFDQAGFSLTVGNTAGPTEGDLNRKNAFFKQTGGVFNSSSSSSFGALFVLNLFIHSDGIFYAPYNSDMTISSQDTNSGSVVASIGYSTKFFHNNGRLVFADPSGYSPYTVYFDAPADTVLNKVVFDLDGGTWTLRTSNLIINNDLEIKSRIRASVNIPKIIRGSNSQKITLRGNLICSGENAGGNMPITIEANKSVKYKVTNSNCKLPPIVMSNSGSSLSEDSSSVNDLKTESLLIASSNIFVAPAASRKIIIEPDAADNSSYAFSNQGSYDANMGELIFSSIGDGSKEFIINNTVSSFYNLKFLNNSAAGHYFNLQGTLYSRSLTFEGSHSINLKSSSSSIVTDELAFNKGLTSNASSLYKIQVSANGFNSITMNTSDRLNVRNLEINRSVNFIGSSNLYDFSGAAIGVGAYNIFLNSGNTLMYNTLFKTSGDILGLGNILPGSL